jgi:actin-related protein 3
MIIKMTWMDNISLVVDSGTGYTKLGYSGNAAPSFSVPTVISESSDGDDLDLGFVVGEDALRQKLVRNLKYPIRHGLVEDWNALEKFYQRSFIEKLGIVDFDEVNLLMSESPQCSSANREAAAEIMFETFGFKGVSFVQGPILSLLSTFPSLEMKDRSLTALVVTSGESITSITPVVDGHVIPSAIQQMNFSGRHITEFVLQRLRDRGEIIPPEDSFQVAKLVKEKFCYVNQGSSENTNSKTPTVTTISKVIKNTHISIKEEQYLAAECFFNPSIIRGQQLRSLPHLIDAAILASPIDTRKELLQNIVLSGGSTMFKNFGRRLEQEVRCVVSNRLKENSAKLHVATGGNVNVKVVSHTFQKDAVWCGGSIIAESTQFQHLLTKKSEYLEHGSHIVRKKVIINSQM